MTNEALRDAFLRISTAAVADACAQLEVPVRLGPRAIRPVIPGRGCVGRARYAGYRGRIESLLGALDQSEPGDVLVVDNGGRIDEACLGGLVAMEAAAAGIAGLIVWGCHRDTAHLVAIDLPVFSLGACPAAPRSRDAPSPDPVAPIWVRPGDVAFADDDGVLFVAGDAVGRVLAAADAIACLEAERADAIAFGQTLRSQLRRPFDQRMPMPAHVTSR